MQKVKDNIKYIHVGESFYARPKQEKGSVAIVVIVAILFIVALCTTMYFAAVNRKNAGDQATQEIKEAYEKDVNRMDDVYATYQENGLYIYTKADLEQFRDRVNSGITFEGQTVYLMNDIDLKSEKWDNAIGNSTNSFQGTFEGNNYYINGINLANNECLFENVGEDVIIQNLKIGNSNSIQDNQKLGIVKEDACRIINCYNDSNELYELPYIPDGFETIEGTIYSGFIIKNETTEDEFVWIPVEIPTVNSEIELTETINNGKYPMAVKTNGQDQYGRDNYRGVLYSFDINEAGDEVGITLQSYNATTGYREPANLTDSQTIDGTSYVYDSQEMFTYQNSGTWTETLYQEEYNKLVESVIANKGFYIGRYESGNLGSKAVSKKGATGINNQTWYQMYKAQKNIYGADSEAKTHMIWGSQWDQVLIWMKDTENPDAGSKKFYILDSTNMGVYSNNRAEYWDNETEKTTGKFEVKNVYDLAGNVYEWTMEARNANVRVLRGGYYMLNASGEPASCRGHHTPMESNSNHGSRLTLYKEY